MSATATHQAIQAVWRIEAAKIVGANPIWRDRVLTSPLGRTIIRNGLVSFVLFQGWGNDPLKVKADVQGNQMDLQLTGKLAGATLNGQLNAPGFPAMEFKGKKEK